ncbi:MAG: hypothetical protein ACI8RP_001508 [Urechidicola sp.]|jgi:hypothetical protein
MKGRKEKKSKSKISNKTEKPIRFRACSLGTNFFLIVLQSLEIYVYSMFNCSCVSDNNYK